MIPYYIRRMEARDSEAMFAIARTALDEQFLPDVFLTLSQSWAEGQFVACDFSGHPIGFVCSARIDGGGVRIMLFAVAPGYQGLGIGTRLVEKTILQARLEMRRFITLEVRKENLRARRFYSRFGFSATDYLPAYYNDGGDAVRMDMFLS